MCHNFNTFDIKQYIDVITIIIVCLLSSKTITKHCMRWFMLYCKHFFCSIIIWLFSIRVIDSFNDSLISVSTFDRRMIYSLIFAQSIMVFIGQPVNQLDIFYGLYIRLGFKLHLLRLMRYYVISFILLLRVFIKQFRLFAVVYVFESWYRLYIR